MKYLALLRGINVGGNNPIKMVELKQAFEASGFQHVRTYINSGNVVFESDQSDREALTRLLEASLSKTFHYDARLIVKSDEQVKQIVSNVPDEWNGPHELRCYIAFLKEHVPIEEVAKEIKPKEGIDSLKVGPAVFYMSTKLSGLTKSGFTKIAGKKLYQDLTIRNYNTTQKLLELMEER